MTPPPSDHAQQDYWCFISYRHADNKEPGRQWANWLHHQIETYEVPQDLVGTTNERGESIPERIFPVFRDEEELPADADLGSPIFRALDRSRTLLVLCSPQAVQSTYVASEISYFKKLGRSDRVLAAMIEGEPNASWDAGKLKSGVDPALECFPEALQFMVDEDGKLDPSCRAEPIAADFRLPSMTQGWTSPEAYRQSIAGSVPKTKSNAMVSAYNRQCELARLKIIAGILGLPLGKLTKRDKIYQLENERRRAAIFRKVAAALALLALAAIVAGIIAINKRQEAIASQKRAESARGEAQNNLERANGLLWEASYSSWSEAERNYNSDEPRTALAYLASGMRSAPENTGLFTFASCILGEPFYPIRTLYLDHPVSNVSFTDEPNEIVIAEIIYQESTRYSLWNIATAEKIDAITVPAEEAISASQKTTHPWLNYAPPPGLLNGPAREEIRKLKSPCTQLTLTADDKRLAISGGKIDYYHPWGTFDDELELECLVLPNSANSTGHAWSPDGSQLISSHGFIMSGQEEIRGTVHFWDLRQAPCFSLIPDHSISLVDPELVEYSDVVIYGDHSLTPRDNGFDIHKIGDKDSLWSLDYDSKKQYTEVTLFSENNEAIVCRTPVTRQFNSTPAKPSTLIIERRKLSTGEILATCSITHMYAIAPSGNWFPTPVRHPGNDGYAFAGEDILLSWNGHDSEPRVASNIGPRDTLGWGGDAAFLEDGRSLLFYTRRKLMAFSWPELTLIAGPCYHETMISDMTISSDGSRAVSAAGLSNDEGSSGYIQIWNLPDLTPVGPQLRHDSGIETLKLDASGRALASTSAYLMFADIRVWDSRTGLPLTNYLVPPPITPPHALEFENFEENSISTITVREDYLNYSFSTRLPTPKEPVPDWIYEHFIPFAAGKKLTPQGLLEKIKPMVLHGHYKKLQEILNESSPEDDDVYLRFVRWHLSNPSSRTIAPYSKTSTDAFLEQHYLTPIRKLGHAPIQNLGEPTHGSGAYGIDPSHPLLHLHLALAEEDEDKKRNLANFGYTLLKKPSNEITYGKERWHEQIRTAQEILTKLKYPELVQQLDKLLSQ